MVLAKDSSSALILLLFSILLSIDDNKFETLSETAPKIGLVAHFNLSLVARFNFGLSARFNFGLIA